MRLFGLFALSIFLASPSPATAAECAADNRTRVRARLRTVRVMLDSAVASYVPAGMPARSQIASTIVCTPSPSVVTVRPALKVR